jgi:hypothetical protein
MSIPNKQIGWSQESNLLWQVSKQLEGISCQVCNIDAISGTSGTSGTSGYDGDRYLTSSTSTFELGVSTTLVVEPGLAYSVAQDVIITYNLANHQTCSVVSYDINTGVLVIGPPTTVTGSGTYSQWLVNLDGAAGGNGTSGTTGTSGTSGSSGSSSTSGTSGTSGSSGTSGVNGAVGGYLGSFYDTTNQTGVAGSVLTMGLNNSDPWNNGVSIVSGSQITLANPGVYNIAFSAQMVKNSGNTATHIHIWLAQNGTTVPISASQIGFPSNSVYVVPAWNFFVKTTTANEYVQLKWEINSNADNAIVMTSAAATGNIPAIPGLIVTVNQVG